jgi:hypothetical protein
MAAKPTGAVRAPQTSPPWRSQRIGGTSRQSSRRSELQIVMRRPGARALPPRRTGREALDHARTSTGAHGHRMSRLGGACCGVGRPALLSGTDRRCVAAGWGHSAATPYSSKREGGDAKSRLHDRANGYGMFIRGRRPCQINMFAAEQRLRKWRQYLSESVGWLGGRSPRVPSRFGDPGHTGDPPCVLLATCRRLSRRTRLTH